MKCSGLQCRRRPDAHPPKGRDTESISKREIQTMNEPKKVLRRLAVLAVALGAVASGVVPAAGTADALRQGFENPPNTARPRVWWHWMNGNITKEGIKLDLEWMHRVGIGGFQNFDAALGTPQVVDKPLVYMTPEWQDAFRFATQLADRLGLEEAIAGSPGWSESGGPWVTPAEAMKKVVWSETPVEGGMPFVGALRAPPSNGGTFQNAPFAAGLGDGAYQPPSYYADTTVMAIRVPDVELRQARPVITSSGGPVDAGLLDDGDLSHTVTLPMAPVGEGAWILFDYGHPQEIRALTYARNDHEVMEQFTGAPAGPELQASDDGTHFHTIAAVPAGGGAEITIGFAPVTARYFRAWFLSTPPPPSALPPGLESLGFKLPPPAKDYHISELALHAGARIHRFHEKAGFTLTPDPAALGGPAVPAEYALRKSEVIDLTALMHADGTLHWTPPAGHWRVLRFGYSLTGVTNHPASPAGTGLEVDKLSARHVRDYMKRYLDNYQAAVGPLMGARGLRYVVNDSYEAGAANWTEDLIAQFTRRRGYDPRPWFPALTGRVVESAAASDRFLWDYRRTLADLIAENHYDQINALLKQRGMGHYGESHESGRAFLGDGMEVKRNNTVPMSAMWTQLPGVNREQYGYDADIRESASVAHIYGQNLVAAESFTAASGAWAWSPETLKPTADQELAMGLNRFVIHTSVHQPLIDKGPGLGLGPFGQWFTRNETWAEPARAWIEYLARSSWLLQQGRFVADVAYFYGEDSNITALFAKTAPDVPAGYNFDYLNADALIHKLHVAGGNLVTASGMSYRLLALDPHCAQMSLPVLRQLRDLVAAGASVAGARPVDTPSLADDVTEFRRIVDELWGAVDGAHAYGRGHVYAGYSVAAALAELKMAPDFEYTQPEADTRLLAVHRHLADGELYFVANRAPRAETVAATFRVSGREPELWHADTGLTEPAAFSIANGRTTVPLKLEPWGSVFVVLRKHAATARRELPATAQQTLATLSGPWAVKFLSGRGAPPELTLDTLASWAQSADTGVRYYSGTARYTHTLQVPAEGFKPGTRLWLDLGEVRNIAALSVNGHDLGVLWKPPFRAEITAAVHPGDNALQVDVTNLWVNRMIGDRQPGVDHPYTFTVPKFYKADSPLLPSGLIGPVTVVQESAQ